MPTSVMQSMSLGTGVRPSGVPAQLSPPETARTWSAVNSIVEFFTVALSYIAPNDAVDAPAGTMSTNSG